MRKSIYSTKGAPPIAPYSPAILSSGTYIFLSGQGPIDPQTGEAALGNFREQAVLTFNNIAALLEASGAGWNDVVKVNVFLDDLSNFSEFNEIYRTYFSPPYPARTTVRADLIGNISIEVDCIAVVS